MPRNGDLPFPFQQQSDFFYLTGIVQEASILVLYPSHSRPSMREVLFIKDANPVTEQWFGHLLSPREAEAISGIRTIRYLSEFEPFLSRLMTDVQEVLLNLNEYPKFSTEVPYRDLRFARSMRERFPLHTFGRIAPLVTGLRMVKEVEEVDMIRQALAITNDAFFRVLESIRPGLMEYEVEAEIVYEMLRQGSPGPAYPPIIGSGKNACVLHYVKNSAECREGDLLLMDFGAEHYHYAADISRTIPVSGRFSPRQRELYDAVHRVMLALRNYYVPGETIEGINGQARRMMAEELVKVGVLTRDDVTSNDRLNKAVQPLMVHGVTHHLGLDVHDVVLPEQPLTEGMVLTCEPGLYLPNEGIGIRIENDILVGTTPLDLCEGIPSSADEIEALILSSRKPK
jgi:Xaa-Pro aminopeptidase